MIKGGGLGAVIDASIRSSTLWPRFSISKPEQPMRNAVDLKYCNYIDCIGDDVEQSRRIRLQYLDRIDDVDTALQWLCPLPTL